VRIALCQTNTGEDPEANFLQVTALLEEAGAAGVDLAALPEVWPRQGSAAQMREAAEPLDGPHVTRLAEVARRHRMWVHGGSVLERDGERIFNTSVLFDRSGELVATYRKIHLFDVAVDDGPVDTESARVTPGDKAVVADVDGVRVGLSVCYDLRFPELYRTLALAGAEVLAVPANFTERTGRDHWEPLLRARAIEDQAFVVAAAQWGTWGPPGRERRNYGHSLVVDPWGDLVAEAPDGVGVTFAELDLARVEQVRQILPSLRHRRLQPSC
jgi:deaminated glutathione amidase